MVSLRIKESYHFFFFLHQTSGMASSSILQTLERVEESHTTLLNKIEELQNKIVAFEVPDFESENEVRTHTACLNAGLERYTSLFFKSIGPLISL